MYMRETGRDRERGTDRDRQTKSKEEIQRDRDKIVCQEKGQRAEKI